MQNLSNSPSHFRDLSGPQTTHSCLCKHQNIFRVTYYHVADTGHQRHPRWTRKDCRESEQIVIVFVYFARCQLEGHICRPK